jgi:hypothetical protein
LTGCVRTNAPAAAQSPTPHSATTHPTTAHSTTVSPAVGSTTSLPSFSAANDGLLPTSPATLGDYTPPLQAIEYYQPPPPPRANLFAMPMTFVQSSAPYYQPRITINFGPTVIHQHALNVPQPHPTPVDSDRGYAEILRGGNGANGGSRGRAKRRTRRNRR